MLRVRCATRVGRLQGVYLGMKAGLRLTISVRLHLEAGARHGKGDELTSQAHERLLDGGLGSRFDHEDYAASASRATDLGGERTLFRGLLDHLVDLRRGDPREVALAVLPFESEQLSHVV